MTDQKLFDPESHWGDFVLSAVAEAERAIVKFPQPNYVISKVAEEAGEVVKAAIHCAEGRDTADNVRKEMRQLVAMLFRLWIEGDQVHGLRPVSAVLHDTGRIKPVEDFPPDTCTAWEDCNHDGICHDPKGCGARGPAHD